MTLRWLLLLLNVGLNAGYNVILVYLKNNNEAYICGGHTLWWGLCTLPHTPHTAHPRSSCCVQMVLCLGLECDWGRYHVGYHLQRHWQWWQDWRWETWDVGDMLNKGSVDWCHWHSLPAEHRRRVKSEQGKKVNSGQGALTAWRTQRNGQVRIQRGSKWARGTWCSHHHCWKD